MEIFCSDLDNTLIYSYRHDIGASKKCVEIYEGREVSFMTLRSLELLKQVAQKLCFIPVTTRTVEQYERICLGIGAPEYALVCNGGVLLVNGVKDRRWYEESVSLAGGCATEVGLAGRLLELDESRCFEVRNIDGLFLFTKSSEPFKTADRLKSRLDLGLVDVFSNGAKVYVVPKKLDKGNGLRRLKERLGAQTVISAGDSEFDIPMLLEADYSFLPGELSKQIELKDHMKACGGSEVFSEVFLSEIIRHMEEKGEP